MNQQTFDPLAVATNLLYTELFGADGNTLRQRLGLPSTDTADDDHLRDAMGEIALEYLAAAEDELARWLKRNRGVGAIEVWIVAQQVGKHWGASLRGISAERGIDVVTGEPIAKV